MNRLFLFLMAGMLVLGGCSGDEEETQPEKNDSLPTISQQPGDSETQNSYEYLKGDGNQKYF